MKITTLEISNFGRKSQSCIDFFVHQKIFTPNFLHQFYLTTFFTPILHQHFEILGENGVKKWCKKWCKK